jgi:septal ring factor EnvC (AmiA/AmiB activator)
MESLEQQLQQQVAEISKEKERWELKKREAEEQLSIIEKDLSNFENTLAAYRRRIGKDTNKPVQATLDSRRFQGRTYTESFKIIARENDGKIRILDAVKILTEAGRIKPKVKNPYGSVNTMLYRNKKSFMKSGPGEYKLIESAK